MDWSLDAIPYLRGWEFYDKPRINSLPKNTDGITIATIYVRPPAGVDSCSPSCYPAQDFLRDKIASPNQASEAEWTNIDQNVGDLADQILAKLC